MVAAIVKAAQKMWYKNNSTRKIIPHWRHKRKHQKAESAFIYAGFAPAWRACMGY